MKLHLPSLLLATLTALQIAPVASADTIGSGVYYDLGKAYYSDDSDLESRLDSKFCWAAGSSNIIQYWQDTYKSLKDEGVTDLPDGVDYTYDSPTGTMYLEVYRKAYENGVYETEARYVSGYPRIMIDWWMKGTVDTQHLKTPAGFNGYFTKTFSDKEAQQTFHATFQDGDYVDAIEAYDSPESLKGQVEKTSDGTPGDNETKWKEMSDFIIETFDTQGGAIALNINSSHIITCWGYETNAEGIVNTLLLSDSDDSSFGIFRAQISIGDTDVNDWEYVFMSYGERLLLSTDDQGALKYPAAWGVEERGNVWITALTRIATPEELTVEGAIGEKKAASSILTSGIQLEENTKITESKTITGDGITVGNGKLVVVLTSDRDKSLSINGSGATSKTTGIDVQEGAMVSLANVTIENCSDSAIKSSGKTYLHDGNISIHDNSSGAVVNSNYFELLDCKSVDISNNTNDGKGGAISNTGGSTVSIRGNEQVTFSGNKAQGGGNDIFNGEKSFLNIADNGSVKFIGTDGSAAIVNEGHLYLRAQDGDSITFENSALDTQKGTTYIGKDIMYRENNIQYMYIFDTNENNGGKVVFTDKQGQTTAIRANVTEDISYATMEHLKVSAGMIAGMGDNVGTMTNAVITTLGELTMSNVSLNSTDIISAQSSDNITFSNVTIVLTMGDMAEGSIFDLTGMFTGNFSLDGITFDLSDESLASVNIDDVSFNLSNAYADKTDMEVFIQKGASKQMIADVGRIILAESPLDIPEPTTGTLGLLALAGLCGRRRRR